MKTITKTRRKFLKRVGVSSMVMGTGTLVAGNNNRPQEKNKSYWDPYDYGAIADGETVDTKAIQTAIDECHKSGGGKVLLYGGTYVSGTIVLRSNVHFHIESGATLLGSENLEDYPKMDSKYLSYDGKYITNKMLIYAENENNITIKGDGMINGNGDFWVEGPYGFPSFSVRPRIIHFRHCENVKVRDIRLYNSASWVQSYLGCVDLLIEGVTVDSRENEYSNESRFDQAPGRNCDGIDIVDCLNVRIANCNINSGDDGIVLKSFSPFSECRNIVITNNVITSQASAIKFGTETSGGFKNITIDNCVVYETWGDAINVSTVDGAIIDGINISNITIRDVNGTAIFIHLGSRGRSYQNIDMEAKTGSLKNVFIQNVHGTGIASGCSISGLVGLEIEHVTLRNINLEFQGAGTRMDVNREVPVNKKMYPNSKVLKGEEELPVYGFFLRDIKDLRLSELSLRFKEEDNRPAVYGERLVRLKIDNMEADSISSTPALISFKDVHEAFISNSRSTDSVRNFLNFKGSRFSSISLVNNDFKNANKIYTAENSSVGSHLNIK